MVRDEARQWADLSEDSDLVHLLHDSVQHLAFERSEDDGLVLHRIHHKSLTSLNYSRTNIVDGSDGDDESIFSRAGALDLCVKLLSDGVEQLRSKIPRMQQDLVFQCDLQ